MWFHCTKRISAFTVFEEISLFFQKQYTTLVGQVDKEAKLKSSIKELESIKGKTISKFLEEAKCFPPTSSSSSGTPCMTLENYEESRVEYKGTEISSNDLQTYPKLSSYLSSYVNEILNQIDVFFPSVISRTTNKAKLDMMIFEPLNQKNWPTTDQEKAAYAPGSIRQLAKVLNMNNENQIQNEFRGLIKKILADDAFFCKHQKDDQLIFWTFVVKRFSMSDTLRYFLLASVLTPMSSADTERRYSNPLYIFKLSRSNNCMHVSSFIQYHSTISGIEIEK